MSRVSGQPVAALGRGTKAAESAGGTAGAVVRPDLPALVEALRFGGWTPLALERGGAPEGWRPAGLDVGGARSALARAERYPGLEGVRGPAAVAATWIVEKEAWCLAALGAAGLLAHGAMPRLRRLWVQEGPDALAIAVWAPADGWRPAGPEQLARELADVMAPSVGALAGARSAKALWRSVGDRMAQGFQWAGQAAGREAEADALLAAALAADTPLHAPLRISPAELEGRRRRTGCCLANRVPSLGRCEDCSVRPKPTT